MSFLNIKDPEERDAMMEEYLAPKERLKERNLEERGELMNRRQELEQTFEPVVASNQRMDREIINDLTPITAGLHEINRNIGILREEPRFIEDDLGASPPKRIKEAEMTPTRTPRQRTLKIGATASKYFKHALNNNTNGNVFGFRFKDEDSQNINNLMIGDKDVHFLAGDDPQIEYRYYRGTPGLYELITLSSSSLVN